MEWCPARTVAGSLGVAAVACLALACNRIESVPAALGQRPNVVLVTIDTLRADHVGAYGAPTDATPVLDGLAARGIRFETVIAPTPITLPSHASLFTGVHPPRHGVRHNGIFRLDDALPTLAEQFRAAGYATGAVVGAVVLRERYGLGRGFDHYDDRVGTRKSGEAGFLERSASEVTDAALDWFAERDAGPYFLWVHYYDPHLDHRAPAAFAERFPESGYAAEVAYVDAELGRLLAGLPAAAETLVAVTSDHGESLGEHDEPSHGMTLYDAALRVPWILAGPDVPAGGRVEGVARLVDVAPTLLSLAGAEALPATDGEDLKPFLAGGALESDRHAYAETLLPELDYGWSPIHAMRSDGHLYVRGARPELYVLAEDPGQLTNRASDGALERIAAAHELRIANVLAAGVAPEQVALDPDERARLQALGYALPERATREGEPSPTPAEALRLQQLVQRGARALAGGRYDEAETSLREFLRHAPRSARAHGLLASVLLYTGRAEEALRHANRAIALDPRPAHRYADRAEIRIVLGDRAGARQDFEHGATIDPDDVRVRMGNLWVAVHRGEREAARAHAVRALELAPEDASVRFRVGSIWLEGRAHELAFAAFREAVRLRPDFEAAQVRLAIEYARRGDVAAALAHHARADRLAYRPEFAVELTLRLAAAGERGAALDLLGEIEARHPGNARVARARQRITTAKQRITTGTAGREGT